jgi:hypothetical protein
MTDFEITELDFDDNTFGNSNSSSNFGGGLELLMNDKVKESSRPTSDIDVEDLNKLENELNELVDNEVPSGYSHKSDLFGSKQSVSFDDKPISLNNYDDLDLGKATRSTENNDKTWDGYGKFNNIPLNPDKQYSTEPKLSKEDTLREKFKYLKKLEHLEKKGVELSKKYSMESSLQEMMAEYETIMAEKSKENSVKFQGNVMMSIVNIFEYLNNKFDPFDIKLDGWADQIQENITDYDEIFGELHEKYKSKATMAPELKLLFQLGGSAMMVHMTNTMFKSAMPGVDDILRQHPDLMRSFQEAAVNSMSQNNPGFSGFMSNVMNSTPNPATTGLRGPPPPIATQGPNAVPPPANRPGNNNFARPDLNMSMNMNTNNVNDGISLRERPEMRGPRDISNILSGIKTKKIDVSSPSPTSASLNNVDDNNNSTISINDLRELQGEGNMPKRSGRRKKSSSNTMSLDI